MRLREAAPNPSPPLLPRQLWPSLLNGAVLGAALALLAFALPRYTRHLLAGTLVVAALVYVFFSLEARTGPLWLLTELAGVGLFGALAVLGLRGSPWWLVAGWALHPIWDILLHHAGPGSAFAPAWYTVPCLSWDLVVAGLLAFRLVRGWSPRAVRVTQSRSLQRPS